MITGKTYVLNLLHLMILLLRLISALLMIVPRLLRLRLIFYDSPKIIKIGRRCTPYE
jgi:hypothetical protein